VRFSPDLKPVTLTTTRTGFLSPVRTSSDTASVIVALNRPVRRCLGRACSIPVRLSLNPMSSNRSASSIMSSSRDFMFKGDEWDVMSSWSRPGVPINTVGGDDLRSVRSLATEEVPPMRRLAESNDTNSSGRTVRNPCSTE
jgi:hypothetical protein